MVWASQGARLSETGLCTRRRILSSVGKKFLVRLGICRNRDAFRVNVCSAHTHQERLPTQTTR